MKVWANVFGNVYWSIGDGRTINFWNDTWLRKIGPLRGFYTGLFQPDDTLHVCNVMDVTGGWDRSRLRSFLLKNILAQIATVVPTSTDAGGLVTFSANPKSGEFLFLLVGRLAYVESAKFDELWDHNSVQVIADTNISWMRNYLRTISTGCNNNPQVTASHWSVLEVGWIKLNMDGPVSPFRSSASIGGVFRDMNGSWLCGFLMRLGGDIIFKVEARAIFKGLILARDKGFRQLELECDNALLVETILVGGAADSNLIELRLIYRLLNRNWPNVLLQVS
ncbi:hypothetical protein Godav_013864 [Gossypium davidsonii]|uniref:RNase H type-1 domain-containing protein n=1 Tax=Gossypium davidsonii TaxID=34287 RepID=A0A7J8RI74_GOSDV|nr:hypothetical protein [Gossypium davidsonii]